MRNNKRMRCTISRKLKRSEQLHFGSKIASSGKHPYKADTALRKQSGSNGRISHELTKLRPYESSNAAPAKMFATRCVRRATSYMRHHNIPLIWNSNYRTRVDNLINVCKTMRVPSRHTYTQPHGYIGMEVIQQKRNGR
jgi:hypothetical protein